MSCDPLDADETLDRVLRLVGPGEHSYVAVCTRFHCTYLQQQRAQLEQQECRAVTTLRDNGGWYRAEAQPRDASETWYKSVFASCARLQHACEADFSLKNSQLALPAGRYMDKATLLWASRNGFEVTEQVCEGAAAAGRTDFLHWLHTIQNCLWDFARVAKAALKAGHLSVLQYAVFQNTAAYTALQQLLCTPSMHYWAASSNSLAMLA
jgi:hypothetical protein